MNENVLSLYQVFIMFPNNVLTTIQKIRSELDDWVIRTSQALFTKRKHAVVID